LALALMRARASPPRRPGRTRASSAPLIANLTASGLYLLTLAISSSIPTEITALLLQASSGCLLALAGVAVVVRSRRALGAAWSLAPEADPDRGLVTSGPYWLVRHPIYLGLALVATGAALAFGSWPALALVAVAIVPTFAWRASAEEKLLSRTFEARYAAYRKQTKMIIPHLF